MNILKAAYVIIQKVLTVINLVLDFIVFIDEMVTNIQNNEDNQNQDLAIKDKLFEHSTIDIEQDHEVMGGDSQHETPIYN
ncbi:hypothetical protein [Rickettsia endosymbiont of Cardiosporidium cionae]|uniref:hypothetical protein n=1 Tax=Rickettsia endosymbiont of Cardiosporidium cionae TaxID=2777155 RepID=UPI001893692D|nr:hypothetical protein [Rickettsia endosymbiont of Cardiosporidium cionae]KAF8818738.1 hypothetical protein IHI24_000465 [Rickettsia endosymbiont of Cardiosporidium cionae]